MLRRVLRVLLKVLLGVVTLVVLLYFLRGPLFGRALADRVARELSEALGGRFTVHGVEGNWITGIAVVGLRTAEAPPHGPLTRLEWGRAAVRYDLFALIDGDWQAAIRSASVSNGVVELDLTRPPAPAPAASPPAGPDPLDAIPLTLPEARLDVAVTVKTADATYGVDELVVAGRGQVFDIALHGVKVPDAPVPETVRMRVERAAPRSFVVTSDQAVEDVRLDRASIELPEAGWRATARLDVAGGTIDVVADPGGARATLTGLDLARLPRVEDAPAGRLAGTVETEDGTRVAFALVVTDVVADGVRVDRVDVSGAWTEAGVVLDAAEARAGDASVRATAIELRPGIPYLVHAVGSARVRIPDLRAYVPELEHAVSVESDVASVRGRRVEIPDLRVRGAETELTAKLAMVLPEDPQAWRTIRFETADVRGRIGDPNLFAADLPRIVGGVHVSGTVTGTVAAPVAVLVVEGNALSVEGRAVETFRLKGELDWPRLKGFELLVDAQPGEVRVQGNADLAAKTVRDGTFVVDIGDLRGFGRMVPGLPRLGGTLKGNGEILWDGARASGRATLRGRDLAVDRTRVGNVSIDATLEGDKVTVESVSAGGPWGQADARGWVHLENRNARVESLVGRYDRWPARLTRPLDVAWDGGELAVTGLDVETLGGRVHGSATWRNGLETTLKAENIHLDRVDERWKGRLTGTLEVAGETRSLVVDAPQLAFEEHRGRLHIEASQDADGIEVQKLEAHLGTILKVEGRAVLPYRVGDDGRVVRLDGRPPRVFLDGTVRDVRRLVGIDASGATVRIEGDADGLEADVRVKDLAFGPDLVLEGETRFYVAASPKDASATLVAAPGDIVRLDGRVALDRGLDWTRPEQFGPLFEEARIEGGLQGELPDVAVLKPLVEGVRRLTGRARVRLTVEGPLRSPDVNGFAEVEALTTVLEGDLPPVQDVAGRLLFDGRTVRTEGLAGKLGYEPVTLAGSVELPPGELPVFALTLRGTNVQLVRDRYLRLRADVDLKLAGALDALEASGKVRVTDALYSRPVDFLAKSSAAADAKFQLFSVRDRPFREMKLDVEVVAEDTVRIRNNLMRGAFSVDMRVRGTGEVPQPEGRITCRDLLVRLPAASLKVDQGELRFPPESPFQPAVNAAGHTRKRGHDLNVTVTGVLPDVDVHVAANPSLSQEDAILLLTVGSTRADLEQQGVERATLNAVGTLFGERLFSEVTGPSDPDERSFFDRFEFEVGSETSRSGQETIAGEFEVTDRWYLRAERDRFDDYNVGVVWRYRFR